MPQVTPKLWRGDRAYYHWCPACQDIHTLPDRWQFDGNLEKPTFSPSFITRSSTRHGDQICHYTITGGVIHFCSDSTHGNYDAVAMPDLPEWLGP